ncbi:gamma-glutamyltransferase [Planctomicrobium sp. SH661]|uniref:gamma-glutamyltransferase n=1 Tax=Planctomicrobium sp. SH661 TaxID=3448124 RepID=UPI003F5B117E
MRVRGTAWLIIGVLCAVCSTALAQQPQVATGTRGMVASVSAPATAVGVEILQQGGTAVDASVAVAFALQVTWPEAGNIGGGGFMMVQPGPGKTPVCIEYRETAPAASTPDMFTIGETALSAKAVGVPGTVRGLELAHRQYGRLPWKQLVEPSVKLARDGFTVDDGLASSLNAVLRLETTTPEFAEFLRIYRKADGTDWESGDRIVQPELAETLQRIADGGADAFYSGPIANLIVEEMRRGNGIISLQDLESHQAKLREPIHVRFNGHDVYGPPLPSSGGLCLAEMLQVLDQFDLKKEPRWSARNLHLQIETSRRVFYDRAKYFGDADFVAIPESLTTPEHARELAASIDLQRATPSRELAEEMQIIEEPPSTTHFSIVDKTGMAVSNTYTLEASYGSRIVVRGAGFLLNNEMGDFNWKAGHTDTRGRIGTDANLIAPGKRMLSSQTPVIVLKDGEPVLVTGSPGGRTIINTLLCVLLNVLEFEMDLPTAVAQPRLHHPWFPDEAQFEKSARQVFPEALKELESMGHRIGFSTSQGDAHSIRRNPATGELQGVADRRRSGSAMGD